LGHEEEDAAVAGVERQPVAEGGRAAGRTEGGGGRKEEVGM
jgi:hypothetical protein